jgi:hypothetical protein
MIEKIKEEPQECFHKQSTIASHARSGDPVDKKIRV